MTDTLAGRLKAARASAGLSQRQLAEASGVSAGAVEDIEQGRTPSPRVDTLLALAKALGVSVERLLG